MSNYKGDHNAAAGKLRRKQISALSGTLNYISSYLIAVPSASHYNVEKFLFIDLKSHGFLTTHLLPNTVPTQKIVAVESISMNSIQHSVIMVHSDLQGFSFLSLLTSADN